MYEGIIPILLAIVGMAITIVSVRTEPPTEQVSSWGIFIGGVLVVVGILVWGYPFGW